MKLRSKRLTVLVLTLALLAAACAGADDAADSTTTTTASNGMGEDVGTMTVLHFFGDCSDEYADNTDPFTAQGECGVFTTVVNKWNAENPGSQIEMLNADWPGTVQLNAALAAGDAPDLAVLHGIRIPRYASRGLLAPMSEAFDAVGLDTNGYVATAADYVRVEGEFYGIPMDLHGLLWHINVDVWEEAGLTDGSGSPVIPTSKDEFLAAAQAVMDSTGLAFMDIQADGHNGTVWPVTSFLYQLGGELADADGNPTVNTPEAVEALEFMMELQEKGYTTPQIDYVAAEERFLNGENASWLTGTWAVNDYGTAADDADTSLSNYLAIPTPQIFGGVGTWANGHTIVSPLGRNADVARVAKVAEFMKFFDDHQLAWTGTGMLAVRTATLASDDYTSQPNRDEYVGFVDVAKAYPRVGWIGAYDDIMNEEIVAAYIGEKSPQEALDDAQSRLEEIARFSG